MTDVIWLKNPTGKTNRSTVQHASHAEMVGDKDVCGGVPVPSGNVTPTVSQTSSIEQIELMLGIKMRLAGKLIGNVR